MTKTCKWGLICLAVAAIFVASALSLVFAYPSVAAADAPLSFTISSEDGSMWLLSRDDGEISRFQGKFLNITGDDAASVFYSEISRVLQEENKEDYTLDFVLPDVGCVTQGVNVFEYSENKSTNFILRAVYQPLISSTVRETLEYKTKNGNYINYAHAVSQSGGLSFGQGVNVGEYDVRIVVYEDFVFANKNYSVPRYSLATGCTIEKATPTAPEVDAIVVEYGTSMGDLAQYISTSAGKWSLSKQQAESEFANVDNYLHVKDGGYKIKFDFTPHNSNYNKLAGVEVPVTVNPRTLSVYIADVFSLVGEPLVTDFAYEITTPLVGDDSEDDLGIELVCEGLDANVAQRYTITAKFNNTNDYVARSVNYNSMFIGGGSYNVYATRETVKTPDGKSFYVMLNDGFKGFGLRIEIAEFEDSNDGLQYVCGYKFIFEDQAGNRVYPEGFTLEWDDGTIVADKFMLVGSNGMRYPANNLNKTFLSMPKETDTVLFFMTISNVRTPMQIASTALAYICGILAVALIVLIAVYFARRRYFK